MFILYVFRQEIGFLSEIVTRLVLTLRVHLILQIVNLIKAMTQERVMQRI